MNQPPKTLTSLACCLAMLAGTGVAPAAAASCASLPTGAGAYSRGEQAGQDPPAVQDSEPETRRLILTLRGQLFVRGLVRTSEDAFEVRRKGSWRRYPAALVEGVRSEQELEAELEERRSAVADEDLDGRGRLASWAMAQGLLREGTRELEALLREDPEHALARAVLTANSRHFGVPAIDPAPDDLRAAADELMRWATGGGQLGGELGVVQLARLRDRGALQEYLVGQLAASSYRRRAFATLGLRRLFPGAAERQLIVRAVIDSSSDVRKGAALALKGAERIGALLPIERALVSRHPTVRAQAAEALGQMGFKAAVEPLAERLLSLTQPSGGSSAGARAPRSNIFVGTQFAYLQDFDVEVAAGSAAADPQVNVLTTGSVLEVSVLSVGEVHFASEARALRTALCRLTGADPGHTNRAWVRWWAENSSRWRSERFLN